MAQTDPIQYKLFGESSLVELFLEMLDTEVIRLIEAGEIREAELLRAWIREADGCTTLRASDVASLASYLDSEKKEIERQKEAGKALHDLRQKNKAAKEAEAAAEKAAEEAAAKQAEAEAAAEKAAEEATAKQTEVEAAAEKAAEEATAKQTEVEAAAEKAPRKPSNKKSAAKRQKKS